MRALFLLGPILFFCGIAQAQQMPGLIPYREGNLWGYSNSKGEVVIKAQWVEAGFFRNGKARVGFSFPASTYGIIREDGTYILPPERRWNGEWTGFKNAQLNRTDDSGRMGMVDTANRALIPALYTSRQTFLYQAYWKIWCLEVAQNGKHGIIDTMGRILIPCRYEYLQYSAHTEDKRLSLNFRQRNSLIRSQDAKPWSAELSQLIIVQRDGQSGVINIDNQTVVPFGQYDHLYPAPPYHIRTVKGQLQGLLDTTGAEIRPPLYHTITPAGACYFAVQSNDRNRLRTGLVNARGDTVLPFRYSGISYDKGLITVSISDSAAPAEFITSRDGHPIGTYARSLDSKTLQPVSNWVYTPFSISMDNNIGFCGTGAHMWAQMQAYELRRPYVRIHDSMQRNFRLDSIIWYTICTAGPGLTSLTGYGDAYPRTRYTAVINKALKYVAGPIATSSQLHTINIKDGLRVWSKDGSYNDEHVFAVLDAEGHVMIPYQRVPIAYAFRWKGHVYALAGEHPMYGSFFDADPMRHLMNYPRLIDSSGLAEKALAGYRLRYMAYPDGRVSDTFEGYFFATDSFGRNGIVAMDGRVLYPKLSFRNRDSLPPRKPDYFALEGIDEQDAGPAGNGWLKPVGNGWFLHKNRWVDSEDKELAPGLRVTKMEPAYYSYIHTRAPLWPPEYVPGVYWMEYEIAGVRKRCYVTANGVVHMAK